MKRAGSALLVVPLLVGCGSSVDTSAPLPSVAASTPQPTRHAPPPPTTTPSVTPKARKTPTPTPQQVTLADLVVPSRTFTRTSTRAWDRERTGPFDTERFAKLLSGTPDEDRRLFNTTGFVRGHVSIRMAADDRRLVIYLYQFRTHEGAVRLQKNFWDQYEHGDSFTVRGLGRTWTDAGLKQSSTRYTATANVNFAVGNILVKVDVTESNTTGKGLRPDTELAAAIARQQRDHLAGAV
ncbi:hypothetical protein BWI15_02490 [Kribbella sp. ALI-6-A]|uniref:hypothetical protein n=1 Tax=Kribbella sp. ALI-6-A TaxID=1933817 RepID=UPI00097C3047|nr:hypothetical protein [Kribbella sp. ALI-6-A]ONI78362.1 hypothetical protein BWI15_02490 [Kribbella sp. ALI-6-A]